MSCNLMDDVGQASQLAGTYSQVLNVTRAFAEMSKPFALGAPGFISKSAPLHIVSLIRAPLDAFMLGGDVVSVVKAPSYLKMLPMMMVIEKIGNILDCFTAGIWIAEQMGARGLESISAACLPIGGVAIGLQAIGVGIMAWKFYEIHAFWDQVQTEIDGDHKAAAVDLLTNKPATKLEKYKQRFFGVLSDDNKKTIREVYDQANPAKLDTMFDLLKDRHFQKKVEIGICIALMIIGVVGLALIVFSGGLAAPIAWGIMGCVAIASLALVVAGIYKQRSFDKALLNCLN